MGCYDIKPVNVTVNPLPAVTGTQTDLLCSGANTGAIDITVPEEQAHIHIPGQDWS